MRISRSGAHWRRNVGRAAVLAPALVVLALDVIHRHASYAAMLRADLAAIVVSWVLSASLWSSAVVASARRRGAGRWLARLVLVLLGAIAAIQAAAYDYFGVTIDFQLLASSWQLKGMASLVQPFLGTLARWAAGGAIAAIVWALLARRIAPTRRRAARWGLGGMLATFAMALLATAYLPHVSTDAAPDVLVIGAVGRLAIERPTRRSAAASSVSRQIDFSRTVTPLSTVEARHPRNVLFILTESVRAQSYCSAYQKGCPYNPFSNEALPDRIALERMRAVDSFTLLSFGVIFTGLSVEAPKRAWLTAPLLFDYAHAAHITTAYWSAQHPAFANSHDWTDHEPIDRLAWATDFDPDASTVLGVDDSDAAARAVSEIPTLREPFFAVVHFSSTHYPYRVDADTPFRPLGAVLDRQHPELIRNRYLDAIYRQDKVTAKLVTAVRATPVGKRTVIVFVSDHGESFFEHGSVLHGSSLWDEELRVPAWVDAPPGLLSPDELASLRARRDTPLTEEDLAPTMLDLLGIYGVPAWSGATAQMPGSSLLRNPAPRRTSAIETCNAVWSCFVRSSGKLIGDLKWVARPPEPHRCFDTRSDPAEQRDLGAAACGQLPDP